MRIFRVSIILFFTLVSCSNQFPRSENFSPESVPASTQTLTPHPTIIPTITPTEDPAPIFPETGTMRSEHLTASLSKRWMENAGISEVKLAPEILEQIYQVLVVHWASSLASFSNNLTVKRFTDYYLCDANFRILGFDFSIDLPKAHLQNALEAFESNSQAQDPFDYSFDFGQGVTGKAEYIDIKVLGNQHEYKYIEKQLTDQEINFVNIYGGSLGIHRVGVTFFL